MQEEVVLEPPLYFAQEHIWDLSFHPQQDILACCLITGAVSMYSLFLGSLKYCSDSVGVLLTLNNIHKDSVRTCRFSPNGNLLATGGKDKRLGFVDGSGTVVHIQKKAHEDSISKVQFINNSNVVSGDDSGIVKIWDVRTNKSVFQVNEQSEAITGFAYSQEHSFLLSSSLDGTLAVYDLRNGGQQYGTEEKQSKALYSLSDCMEEELLGLEIIENGRFVACNSSEGVILLFKWDWFGNCKDRIQGHPNSIDAMIKLNETTLITGSEDGFVRGVSIHPNKIVRVLGQHEDDEHFPVQKIDIAHCRKIMASVSHDNSIKFYDINDFVKSRDGCKVMSEAEEDMEEEIKVEPQKSQDIESDSFDQSDEDSDSEEMKEEKSKKKKKRNKTNIRRREGEIAKDKRAKFFNNL